MSEDKKSADRRGFLKLAGVSVVGGSAAAATSVIGSQPALAEQLESEDKRLYRESEHIRRYYDLAREY